MKRPQSLTYHALVAAPPPAADTSVLAVHVQQQQMPEWCWAAVSASLKDFFARLATPTAQCGIVNGGLAPSQRDNLDACTQPTPAACDKPWYLEFGLDAAGIGRETLKHAISFDDVVTQLAAGAPPCVLLAWHVSTVHQSGGGHFVTLYGHGPTSGEAPAWISIGDPLYGDTVMNFDNFPASYHGGAAWSQTYRVTWPAPNASAAKEATS